jgi:tetratricopeptide (TPR) repeat protein
MIKVKIETVFDFLNKFDPSKLRPLIEPLVVEMKKPSLTEAQLDALLIEALEKSRYPFIPLEYAEIKTNVALEKFKRKKYEQSEVLLSDALDIYLKSDDFHRQAMIYWMHGLMMLERDDLPKTYQYWDTARNLLSSIAAGKKNPLSKADVIQWYQERIKDLNYMMISYCIQEIYAWMDVADPASLDNQSQKYCKKIQDLIIQRKNSSANEMIINALSYAKLSNNFEQQRDLYVYCGVAKYQLGIDEEAIKYFNLAINALPRESHRMAVTYWLMAMTEWRSSRRREEAVVNYNKSLQLFKELNLTADKKNNTFMKNWYKEKLVYIEKCIEDKESEILV